MQRDINEINVAAGTSSAMIVPLDIDEDGRMDVIV